jgi:hypothetical protein
VPAPSNGCITATPLSDADGSAAMYALIAQRCGDLIEPPAVAATACSSIGAWPRARLRLNGSRPVWNEVTKPVLRSPLPWHELERGAPNLAPGA